VIQIEGNSCRLREHAELVPEQLRNSQLRASIQMPNPKLNADVPARSLPRSMLADHLALLGKFTLLLTRSAAALGLPPHQPDLPILSRVEESAGKYA